MSAATDMADDDVAAPSLWSLPPDALAHVAKHLSVADLLSLRRACKALRAAVDNDALWAHAFRSRWPVRGRLVLPLFATKPRARSR